MLPFINVCLHSTPSLHSAIPTHSSPSPPLPLGPRYQWGVTSVSAALTLSQSPDSAADVASPPSVLPPPLPARPPPLPAWPPPLPARPPPLPARPPPLPAWPPPLWADKQTVQDRVKTEPRRRGIQIPRGTEEEAGSSRKRRGNK